MRRFPVCHLPRDSIHHDEMAIGFHCHGLRLELKARPWPVVASREPRVRSPVCGLLALAPEGVPIRHDEVAIGFHCNGRGKAPKGARGQVVACRDNGTGAGARDPPVPASKNLENPNPSIHYHVRCPSASITIDLRDS